jgi:uncharacterized protein (DUF427 family)
MNMSKTEARWNGKIIAASDDCIAVEGNACFPPDSLKKEFFASSPQTSVCSWKGDCNYFDLIVDGKTNASAGWVYNNPKAVAAAIKCYVAFWKGVDVKGGEFAKPMA